MTNLKPASTDYMPPSDKGATKPLTFNIGKAVSDSDTGMIDSGKGSNYPSLKEMRKSQADGATGTGTAEKSYSELMEDFNQ